TTLPDGLPESITKNYGVTAWGVPWTPARKTMGSTALTLAEKIAAHDALIQKHLTLWPSVDKMLVWHESGAMGAAFPTELWGEAPPAPDAKESAAWQERMEYVTALAEMVRAKYPNLKLQYGNDGNSMGIIAGLLRRKFPRKYIDTI